MKKIEMTIECPSCKGTGLYQGMAEGNEVAVVCKDCGGTGAFKYSYSYNEFTGRKTKKGVKRVYLTGGTYRIGTGVINYDGIGPVNMDIEGVSYKEFLEGKMPKHIEKLGCPMLLDQSAYHSIKGFTDRCNKLHGGWLSWIPDCKNRKNSSECWKIFNKGKTQ